MKNSSIRLNKPCSKTHLRNYCTNFTAAKLNEEDYMNFIVAKFSGITYRNFSEIAKLFQHKSYRTSPYSILNNGEQR